MTTAMEAQLINAGIDPDDVTVTSRSFTYTYPDGTKAIFSFTQTGLPETIETKASDGTSITRIRMTFGAYGAASSAYVRHYNDPEELAITFNYNSSQELASWYDHENDELTPFAEPVSPFPPLLEGPEVPPSPLLEADAGIADAFQDCLNGCENAFELTKVNAKNQLDTEKKDVALLGLLSGIGCLGLIAIPFATPACLAAVAAAMALALATAVNNYWRTVKQANETFQDCMDACETTYNQLRGPVLVDDGYSDPFSDCNFW